MEKQTHDIARCEQSANRIIGSIEHLRLRIDLQTAEGERDTTGDRIGPIRRFIDRVGPVRFLWCDPLRATAV